VDQKLLAKAERVFW